MYALVQSILIAAIIILVPRLMLYLAARYKVLGVLGTVFLCYAVGIIFSFIFTEKGAATTMSEIMVPIAIPLILFSSDISALKKLAKPAIKSFVLVIVSVIIAATTAFFVFRNSFEYPDKLSGMLVGLYTGGTPNLMAIGMALGVPPAEIGVANTADLISGGIYFVMLLSFMPKLFEKLLPPFKLEREGDEALCANLQNEFVPTTRPMSIKRLIGRVPMVLLAIAILGVAAGIALLITGELDVAIVMLVVTTLGIACSFIKRIREKPNTFSSGQYFILMFSLAIGISFDLSLIDKSTLMLFIMFFFTQILAAVLHFLFAAAAKLDAHTTLITSTAGIYGPAFIIPVAGALKNKEVILPGLICGILGYAVGNYLGVGLAYLLAMLL